MFEYFSKPKFNPKYINHDSFILCRPGKSYKVNASVSVIKRDNPILFDVGIDWHMMFHLEDSLKIIKKSPKDVKIAMISHFHPDHCLNLLSIRRFYPNCRIIWHEKTQETLTNFISGIRARKKSSNVKLINLNMRIMEFLEARYILQKNSIFTCKDNDYIPTTNKELKVIHTPGHSAGHICLLDKANKILFLGDHLPLTPWLDISENSIDNMISSIQKVLKLSTNEVHFSVRGHGNIGDNSREIYPWKVEKARFQDHLTIILKSIEKMHDLLNKKPMSVDELAQEILKNKDYRDYSSLMNTLFMPPNLTWIYCYLLKLKKENKIKRIGNKWTAI